MSALTYEIKDPRSPVAVWLHTKFPEHKPVQAAFRTGAGTARIPLPTGVSPGTQGAAIDWWLRFLLDPAPSLDLALVSLRLLPGEPCVNAGLDLLTGLGSMPTAIVTLIEAAIEVGYVSAMNDARDGKLDGVEPISS